VNFVDFYTIATKDVVNLQKIILRSLAEPPNANYHPLPCPVNTIKNGAYQNYYKYIIGITNNSVENVHK
jgi:hypothetical protein